MQWMKFAELRSALDRLVEYHVLYPVFAVVVLGVIWGATWKFINLERAGAENAAAVTSRELAETYEAQTLRALREIDQTLRLVRHVYEREGDSTVLADLKKGNLLPTEMLFLVSIVDLDANIVASSRSVGHGEHHGKVDFARLRRVDVVDVSQPWKQHDSGEWLLCFSRRLSGRDGKLVGAVMVTVEAAYFTSGYESSKLGTQGMLGLLGTDGVFRVRRVGDKVSAGDAIDFAAMDPDAASEAIPMPMTSPWDKVRRYTAARDIYDFPLVAVAGLAEDEQLAAARRNKGIYLWRAAGSSVVLLALIGMGYRMSRQLALVRRREAEARVAYAERVEYLAYHDGLTGLPNRSLFSKLLDQSILQARRYKKQLAVLFLDLDRFKQVNDMLGHDAGDELLKEVARRLKSCLRESDTVARLGGDEFVILLPELEDDKYVARVAQKMLESIAAQFRLMGQESRITVSIGISLYPRDGEDEQMLRKNADIAMYRAKDAGKNGFCFFSESVGYVPSECTS